MKKSEKKKKITPVIDVTASYQDQLTQAKEVIAYEKAGKRKLFHSLLKLANELRKMQKDTTPLLVQQRYANRNWYEGGMWRSPQILPTLSSVRTHHQGATSGIRTADAVSLSDLFFTLVTVAAFTRVGVYITQKGTVDMSSIFYFAVFWVVWYKQVSYSTRFDTTDLSAQVETLIACFVVLFASLSVKQPVNTIDGSRIMMMAAFVAVLHCCLHIRVAISVRTGGFATVQEEGSNEIAANSAAAMMERHVMSYAVFNTIMNALEALVWFIGLTWFPVDWEYRWCIFLVGLLMSLRVPGAFLANDFRAACSHRGVLFILLLGFLLQSILVVSSEFFSYQTPTIEHYSFMGAICLLFFCIKLSYVDDAAVLAKDHALSVNRVAAFFFNVGQFALLLSTTVMGSGLNLLTHDYMAATAALSGPSKSMVCGGFSATLLSTWFIKSMHLKRVPIELRHQLLYVTAYALQTIVLITVVAIAACMAFWETPAFLDYLKANDIGLLFSLSGAAFFVVIMGYLDEGVELALYNSSEHANEYLVHPVGFWRCLKPTMSEEDIAGSVGDDGSAPRESRRLSILQPFLGGSSTSMLNEDKSSYGSLPSIDI